MQACVILEQARHHDVSKEWGTWVEVLTLCAPEVAQELWTNENHGS